MTDLVPFKAALPAVSNEQMDVLDDVAKATEFLQRVQLYTKGKPVDKGIIPSGHWGIPLPGGEEIQDLGTKIDIIPFCFRPKALDMSDKEAIISVFDTKDEEFQRIKNAGKDSGCMWGPSFLVLVRSETCPEASGKLYEMFFGNKSGRQEAGKLKPFLPTEANGGVPSPASLGVRYVEKGPYGWHVPVIAKCSEPFDASTIKVTDAQIAEEMKKFLNPKKTVERVEETEERAR